MEIMYVVPTLWGYCKIKLVTIQIALRTALDMYLVNTKFLLFSFILVNRMTEAEWSFGIM